jgi:hypothetical protein
MKIARSSRTRRAVKYILRVMRKAYAINRSSILKGGFSFYLIDLLRKYVILLTRPHWRGESGWAKQRGISLRAWGKPPRDY